MVCMDLGRRLEGVMVSLKRGLGGIVVKVRTDLMDDGIFLRNGALSATYLVGWRREKFYRRFFS